MIPLYYIIKVLTEKSRATGLADMTVVVVTIIIVSSSRCRSRAGFVAVALSAGHVEIAASRWKSLCSANIFAVGASHTVTFELATWGFAHTTLCHLNLHHPNAYN